MIGTAGTAARASAGHGGMGLRWVARQSRHFYKKIISPTLVYPSTPTASHIPKKFLKIAVPPCFFPEAMAGMGCRGTATRALSCRCRAPILKSPKITPLANLSRPITTAMPHPRAARHEPLWPPSSRPVRRAHLESSPILAPEI